MEMPKFSVGQPVKFIGDHDHLTGKVLSFNFNSESGFTYVISSRIYDPTINDMVEGQKICRESELVDMTDYTGPTTPLKASRNVNLKD